MGAPGGGGRAARGPGQHPAVAAHGAPRPRGLAAHFRNLFVAKEHWGSGLAKTLHDASVEEARRRGFEQMRLFTPAEHARARRFYEREGWLQRGEPFDEPRLGMALVEYRYALA